VRLCGTISQDDRMSDCTHLDQIQFIDLPENIPGCEDCLAIGGRWVHLRMCQSCGKIGCCDSSPNRHASKHAGESGHPIVRSAESGEDWSWCFVDEVAFVVRSE
jgi:hypothetical protein